MSEMTDNLEEHYAKHRLPRVNPSHPEINQLVIEAGITRAALLGLSRRVDALSTMADELYAGYLELTGVHNDVVDQLRNAGLLSDV